MQGRQGERKVERMNRPWIHRTHMPFYFCLYVKIELSRGEMEKNGNHDKLPVTCNSTKTFFFFLFFVQPSLSNYFSHSSPHVPLSQMTRIISHVAIVAITAITALHSVATAQANPPAPYDCEKISIDGHDYNISALKAT